MRLNKIAGIFFLCLLVSIPFSANAAGPTFKSYMAPEGSKDRPAATATDNYECSDKIYAVIEVTAPVRQKPSKHLLVVKWFNPEGELDEQTRTSWQELLAPEPKRNRRGKYPAEADATSLKAYLDTFVLTESVNQLCAENRSVFRTQVLGEALDCDKLERLGRYEVQLDRKLERMLAMLLRLQEFRRSNKVG